MVYRIETIRDQTKPESMIISTGLLAHFTLDKEHFPPTFINNQQRNEILSTGFSSTSKLKMSSIWLIHLIFICLVAKKNYLFHWNRNGIFWMMSLIFWSILSCCLIIFIWNENFIQPASQIISEGFWCATPPPPEQILHLNCQIPKQINTKTFKTNLIWTNFLLVASNNNKNSYSCFGWSFY